LEWLEDAYPLPPLLPQDFEERLFVRQICLMIVSGIQPLQNLSALQKHSDDPTERKEHAQFWIRRGFSAIEKRLQSTESSNRCLKQTTTLADICLIPQVYNAMRHEVTLSDYPRIKTIYDSCLLDPHCFASSPEQQTMR
jgi:maleylacetoacetate isomerase